MTTTKAIAIALLKRQLDELDAELEELKARRQALADELYDLEHAPDAGPVIDADADAATGEEDE